MTHQTDRRKTTGPQNSPFVEGNAYRFTTANQPCKHVTPKQQVVQIYKIFSRQRSEVEACLEQANLPLSVRLACDYMLSGEVEKLKCIIQILRADI